MCLAPSMTLKEYNQVRNWTSGFENRPFQILLSKTSGGAKREAQGAFSNADWTRAHVLTLKSTSAELIDNFIENSYKEWQEFEYSYRLRKLNRLKCQPPRYQPTDFKNLWQ